MLTITLDLNTSACLFTIYVNSKRGFFSV